jgi:outer membrane protein TolC
VATAHQGLAEMSEADARLEAARTDLAVLEAERDRLRRRLEFWKGRHLDLTTA